MTWATAAFATDVSFLVQVPEPLTVLFGLVHLFGWLRLMMFQRALPRGRLPPVSE